MKIKKEIKVVLTTERFESVSDDAHTILESDGAVRWCFFKSLLLGVEVLGP